MPFRPEELNPLLQIFRQWWRRGTNQTLLASEKNLLQLVNEFTQLEDVALDSHVFMHTIKTDRDSSLTPLVCMHGYAAGSGTFLPALRRGLGHSRNVFLLDWPGQGLGSPVKWKITDRISAERFFIDNLEEWRQRMGLDKIVLLGHSMGGYLSCRYALKYPENVERLILVSPVGVGEGSSSFDPSKARLHIRMLFGFLKYGWENGITPHNLLCFLGPIGQKMFSKYQDFHFAGKTRSALDEESELLMRDYTWQIMVNPKGSEKCLPNILSFGAWAHEPLIRELSNMKVPIDFVYGQYDWMEVNMAVEAKSVMSVPSRIAVVDNCGHQILFQQPTHFANTINYFLGHINSTSSFRRITKADPDEDTFKFAANFARPAA